MWILLLGWAHGNKFTLAFDMIVSGRHCTCLWDLLCTRERENGHKSRNLVWKRGQGRSRPLLSTVWNDGSDLPVEVPPSSPEAESWPCLCGKGEFMGFVHSPTQAAVIKCWAVPHAVPLTWPACLATTFPNSPLCFPPSMRPLLSTAVFSKINNPSLLYFYPQTSNLLFLTLT